MNPSKPLILIVDDHAANRATLETLLDPEGYQLIQAGSGPEALARAAETPPDLVLLDVMMLGMDGYEVCRRLRADARLAEVPVIMVTALDDQPSRLAGLEAGADDFITKPFNRAELRARVRSITRLNRYRRLVTAQERIREQAHWLDEASDAIFVRDLEDVITYWNQGSTRLFGWTRQEAEGRPAAELMHQAKAPLHQAPLQAVRDTGTWQGETRKVTKAGREVIVASRLTLLRDPCGEPHGILCIDTDITERKRAERQRQRAQRLESIGRLASGVAHDLNNALAPVLMGADVLRTKCPSEAELIDTMENCAKRGVNMVRQLLTFARGGEGERAPVQTKHLLEELKGIIQGTFPKSIQLQTACAPELKTIWGDATQIHQVLLNLCINARDAMPDGGTLTLEAENAEIGPADASSLPEAKPGRYVVWRVTDTGTGIPPEMIESIFEPFFTTKGADEGTGLGLAIVSGIVQSHGGVVRVDSEPGQGSTFAIYLPAEGPRAVAATSLTPRDEFRGNGKTILGVDDEAAERETT